MTSSANSSMKITVTEGGTLLFVYDDDLRQLLDLGPADVRRASHVEPVEDLGWTVDLSPIGGPRFERVWRYRAQALAAEREYLESPAGVALLVAFKQRQRRLDDNCVDDGVITW